MNGSWDVYYLFSLGIHTWAVMGMMTRMGQTGVFVFLYMSLDIAGTRAPPSTVFGKGKAKLCKQRARERNLRPKFSW